jgi:hypothetical protein
MPWITREALRHGNMSRGFCGIPIRERREMHCKPRVVGRLGARNQLLQLQFVQKPVGPVLCRRTRSDSEQGNERHTK